MLPYGEQRQQAQVCEESLPPPRRSKVCMGRPATGWRIQGCTAAEVVLLWALEQIVENNVPWMWNSGAATQDYIAWKRQGWQEIEGHQRILEGCAKRVPVGSGPPRGAAIGASTEPTAGEKSPPTPHGSRSLRARAPTRQLRSRASAAGVVVFVRHQSVAGAREHTSAHRTRD